MSYRAMYVTPADFDRVLLALTSSTEASVPRAVVVEDDGPLFYKGPVVLKWDEDGEGFKLLTAELAGEVLPRDIDGWQMKVWPKGRIILLAENGYYRVQVYDTLKGGSE